MFWELSFYELTGRVKLKFGELNARMLCQYTSFADVVSGLFGKSEGSPAKNEDVNDLGKAPTLEAALAGINNALKLG